MRMTRDEFLGLLRSAFSRDDHRLRAIALTVVANDKSVPADMVNQILGKERPETVVPSDLQGIVRQTTPWLERDDLVCAADIDDVISDILHQQAQSELLRARGLSPVTRLLLHGPSGTGKTSFAAVLAGLLDLPFLVVPMDTIVGSYLGETSGRLRKVFDFIAQHPSVVLFDEIDAIAKERNSRNEIGEQGRILTTLLVLFDELARRQSQTIILAATNLEEALDKALVRRFDMKVEFPLPSPEDQRKVADRVFQKAQLPTRDLPPNLRGHTHAVVETWALRVARQEVMGILPKPDRETSPVSPTPPMKFKSWAFCGHANEYGDGDVASCVCTQDCACRETMCRTRRTLTMPLHRRSDDPNGYTG